MRFARVVTYVAGAAAQVLKVYNHRPSGSHEFARALAHEQNSKKGSV